MATLTKTLLPISGYTDQYYSYQCLVTENSYNIANNTSNVTITFSIKGPWAPSFYEWTTYYGIMVDGVVKKSGNSVPYISNSYYQLLSWTGDVVHNSNGAKSINVGVYLYQSGPANYLPKQYTSGSPLSMGSVALTTIPKASTITSAGNVTLGNSCSIKWTPASSDFKYKIKFALGSWNYTTDFISPATTSAYTYTGYTIPCITALLDDMPNSIKGTMTATLTTYNSSGSQMGSSSTKNFTVTIPSNIVPTIGTITLTPIDSSNGDTRDILVQNNSKLIVSVSGCYAGAGSSIQSYTFYGPNLSTTTSNSTVTSGIITSAGTLTYTVKVTDKRGRSSSKTATITSYSYSTPYFKSFSVIRSDFTGAADDNGEYVNVSYSIGFSPVNGTNNVSIKLAYKKNADIAYSSVNVISSSTATSGNRVLNAIAIDSTYSIYGIISDAYGGTSRSSMTTVPGASRVFNVTSDGTGFAIGKMAESTELFDCRWPIRSDSPEQTMRNLTYRSIIPVTAVANDTTTNWAAQGNLATTFYNETEQLTDQPGQYGFVLNVTNGPDGAEVHQLWAPQYNGSLAHRGGNSNGWIGSWRTVLDSSNYASYVDKRPVVLYSSSSGTSGTVTLSETASNFNYLEIFYSDENGTQHNSAKVYAPDGKYVTLSCIEPRINDSYMRAYLRAQGWTISGTTMTVGRTDEQNTYAYIELIPGTDVSEVVKVTERASIKIYRVLGCY